MFAGETPANARRRPRCRVGGRDRSEPGAARRSSRGPPFDRQGRARSSRASPLGLGDALRADPRVFVFGEDVGGAYGNAFLLLRPLLAEFGDRIINSPLAEGAVLGVCVGAALAGQRPIGEMQFNDFVATGFNQLVNNAAKIRYRWGGEVPMVVRMPWGGLRHAGPVPLPEHRALVLPHARPQDRRALDAARRAGADGERRSPIPIRSSSTSTSRSTAIPRSSRSWPMTRRAPVPLGTAALRRAGDDLAIISYGAYVHVALRVAERLAARGHRGQRPRPAIARAARSRRACWPSRATAAGC